MLNFPPGSELMKPLSKKAIFEKFSPSASERKRIDRDIVKMTIVGELAPSTVNVAPGAKVAAIYIVNLTLRDERCDGRNLLLLAKWIPQKMVFILQGARNARLAAVENGCLVQSEEKPLEEFSLRISGLDLDEVWRNIVIQIGKVKIWEGRTLAEQLEADCQRAKTQAEIERLEKLARAEVQPRRKWKIAEKIKQIKDGEI